MPNVISKLTRLGKEERKAMEEWKIVELVVGE